MFAATGLSDSAQQPVSITAVDLTARTAQAMTRRMSYVTIDLRYHVGGLQVTPAVGEKWLVTTANSMQPRLVSKIPSNAPEMLVEPQPGQVQIGSSGPLELHGSFINARSAIQLASYTSEDRPDPTTLAPGAMIYDLDSNKLLLSDGEVWRNSLGEPV